MNPYLRILRPLNLIQGGLAVVLATLVLHPMEMFPQLYFLMMSVMLINGAGNIINDIADIDIDKINQPKRPLPSGEITLLQAKWYSIILFFMGILASAFVNIQTFLIAAFVATPLLLLYARKLKKTPLWGNILVAFVLGLTFLFVGAAFHRIGDTTTIFALAFGFSLIREIIKDMEDVGGDAHVHAKTFPLVFGFKKTLQLLAVLIVVFCIADVIPWYIDYYTNAYLYIIMIGINLPLITLFAVILRYPEQRTFRIAQLFLKYDIFIGFLAIWIGAQK